MSRQRIFVRLRGSGTRFYDPATKFRIKLDEVKELVYPLGDMTRQWLNAGGLVIDPINNLPPQEAPGVNLIIDTQPDLLSVNEIEQTIKPSGHDEYDYMAVYELRSVAKSKGVKLARTDTAQAIRAKLRQL